MAPPVLLEPLTGLPASPQRYQELSSLPWGQAGGSEPAQLHTQPCASTLPAQQLSAWLEAVPRHQRRWC